MGLNNRLQFSIQKAVRRRRIFPYLAAVTVVLGLGAGLLMTLVDEKDFPHFGIAVWWAIVTLATVGYGDVVPTTPWGRLVASGVIVLGVTFLAFLTATVTSAFVSSQQEETQDEERERRAQADEELLAAIRALDARLEAIEKKLGGSSG
jgi:voltage-gated potassium channel